MVAWVGTDKMTGVSRFDYGQPSLLDGIPFIAAAMGMFGVTQVLINLETSFQVEPLKAKWREVYPTLQDWKDSVGAFWRGTIIGFFIGVLPGAGATIASFIAYATEKKASRHPKKFGTGVIEGVAAPEGANNAATAGAMVPLLLLLIINLPLVPLFAKVLTIPYWLLGPRIIMMAFVGVYSLNNSLFDAWLLLIFSVIGYFMAKLDFPVPPVVLGLVLGPMMETDMKRALQRHDTLTASTGLARVSQERLRYLRLHLPRHQLNCDIVNLARAAELVRSN